MRPSPPPPPPTHLQVVQQPAGGGHQEIDSLRKLLCLNPAVGPAHRDAMGVVMVEEELCDNPVCLQGQLSSGGDDDDACALGKEGGREGGREGEREGVREGEKQWF